MKTLKILISCIAILCGVFLFVFGEYDNSPGGQLLGVVLVAIAIFGIIKTIRPRK